MFTDEMLEQAQPPEPKVAFSIERSELKYPTTAPDGRSWSQYFQDYYSDLHANDEADDEEEDDDPGVIVTRPAEFVDSGWPRAVSPYVKLLTENGWQFRVGHAESLVPTVHYVDASRGVRYPEKQQETWWIDAVRDGIRIRASWTYRNGKAYPTAGGRTSNDKFGLYSDAEFRELIQE